VGVTWDKAVDREKPAQHIQYRPDLSTAPRYLLHNNALLYVRTVCTRPKGTPPSSPLTTLETMLGRLYQTPTCHIPHAVWREERRGGRRSPWPPAGASSSALRSAVNPTFDESACLAPSPSHIDNTPDVSIISMYSPASQMCLRPTSQHAALLPSTASARMRHNGPPVYYV